MSRLRDRLKRGYTVMETLIAVAVTAVGFSAVFSMQVNTFQGNLSAKDFAAAVNLAEKYAEVLRRESLRWTSIAVPPPPLLSRADETWHTFSEVPLDHNDLILDEDVGSDLGRQRFCAHYWLSAVGVDPYRGLINGRVRVIWSWDARREAELEAACAEASADAFDGLPGGSSTLRSVTLPVTLRFHQPGT